ncbi:MAG: hypothetical protein ACXVZ4_04325 [Gaiellaceae bacterium]
MMLRGATIVLAAALVAPAALAAYTPTPAELNLAMKNELQRQLNQRAKGLVVGKVTCTIATSKRTATCRAAFTAKAAGKKGVYGLAVKLGVPVSWTTTRVRCTSIKTGRRVAC